MVKGELKENGMQIMFYGFETWQTNWNAVIQGSLFWVGISVCGKNLICVLFLFYFFFVKNKSFVCHCFFVCFWFAFFFFLKTKPKP